MRKPRSILVGLKTLDRAVDLTDLACRVAARNGSLLLVHVIELPDPTPLDAEVPELEALAAKIVKSAGRVASRSKIRFKSKILRAHGAGQALLMEMKESRSELAVLGFHHGRTLGERLLGTTAQHLARNAPCNLLLSIPPHS